MAKKNPMLPGASEVEYIDTKVDGPNFQKLLEAGYKHVSTAGGYARMVPPPEYVRGNPGSALSKLSDSKLMALWRKLDRELRSGGGGDFGYDRPTLKISRPKLYAQLMPVIEEVQFRGLEKSTKNPGPKLLGVDSRKIISNIVGREHVGTPDVEIEALIRGKLGNKTSEPFKKEAVAWALKCHRENQGLYRDVMGPSKNPYKVHDRTDWANGTSAITLKCDICGKKHPTGRALPFNTRKFEEEGWVIAQDNTAACPECIKKRAKGLWQQRLKNPCVDPVGGAYMAGDAARRKPEARKPAGRPGTSGRFQRAYHDELQKKGKKNPRSDLQLALDAIGDPAVAKLMRGYAAGEMTQERAMALLKKAGYSQRMIMDHIIKRFKKNPGRLVRRWQTRGGKHWIELYQHDKGFSYREDNGGGNLGDVTLEHAYALIGSKISDYARIDGINMKPVTGTNPGVRYHQAKTKSAWAAQKKAVEGSRDDWFSRGFAAAHEESALDARQARYLAKGRSLKKTIHEVGSTIRATRARRNPGYVWVRLGDQGDYENYDSLKETAIAVAAYVSEVSRWRSDRLGFEAPGFEGQNYISIFYGDAEAEMTRGLSAGECRLFESEISASRSRRAMGAGYRGDPKHRMPKKNPGSPSEADIAKIKGFRPEMLQHPDFMPALRKYIEFHGCMPSSLTKVNINLGAAAKGQTTFLAHMGKAPEVSYKTTNPKSNKAGSRWIHEFCEDMKKKDVRDKDLPDLACTADGKAIITVGGRFEVKDWVRK